MARLYLATGDGIARLEESGVFSLAASAADGVNRYAIEFLDR